MKKIVSYATAITMLFTGLNIGKVIAFDESADHTHQWTETTETIHHDAEYTTKTTWYYGLEWVESLPKGSIPEAPNKFQYNFGKYAESFGTWTDQYDIICWYYDSLEKVPEEYIAEWITFNNYEDYGLTYEEFYNQTDKYYLFGYNNPEFNPKYTVYAMSLI